MTFTNNKTMKYFLICIFAVILVSCSDNKTYIINGRVADSSLNGRYIYLQQVVGSELVTYDSALVEEDKFRFKGALSEPFFSELTFGDTKKSNYSPAVFILEKGIMEAYIDTCSYVRGGVANNNLAEYYAQTHYYDQKIKYLDQQHERNIEEGRVSDSLSMAFEGWHRLYSKEKTDLALQFVEKNNDNLAGVLVFLQNFSNFTREEVRNILFYAGPVFKNDKAVKVLEEYMEKTEKK